MKTVFLMMFAAGAASAQNSDLGFLVGIWGPSSQAVTGTQFRVSGSVGASSQINYAMQLKEGKAGRLYLELPLLFGARTSDTIAETITSSVQTAIYFTPGVRFNVPVHHRVSFYAAAGAGIASFHHDLAVVGKGSVSQSSGWASSFAGAFGGGLDFRITRLVSLRAEVRDFVSRRGVGLTDGRNHAVFGFGMGFHW